MNDRQSSMLLLLGVLALSGAGPTTRPTSAPKDAELDEILSHADQAPATQPAKGDSPASRPSSPFVQPKDDSRPATIHTSDGEKISGPLRHTSDKPLRVWVEKEREYRDVPFKLVQKIEAKVVWERMEPEWHFKESGSDIKEYSGKFYPARQTEYTFTLLNGQTVTGGVVEPLYLETRDGPALFALHKTNKGEVGQPLKQLVYVQSVEFK